MICGIIHVLRKCFSLSCHLFPKSFIEVLHLLTFLLFCIKVSPRILPLKNPLEYLTIISHRYEQFYMDHSDIH